MIDEWTGWHARDASKDIKCDKKCTESKINLFIATSLIRFDKHYVKMIALQNEWFCSLIKILQRPIYLSLAYVLKNFFIEDKDHTPETLAIFAEKTRTIIKTLQQLFCSFQELRDVLHMKGCITRVVIVNSCRAHDQK